MGILKILTGPITGLIKEVGGLLDGVTTTTEEKLSAQAKLAEIHNAFVVQMASLDTQFAVEQAKVLVAEAQSKSWLAQSWRPLTMLMFASIIGWNYLVVPILGAFTAKIVATPIVPEMWSLLQLGIGGYIAGRSAEKIAPAIAEVLKKK